MKNLFLVTLDTATTPYTLIVSDRGKADMAQKRHPQTLVWILADELAKGQFDTPGFAFTTTPPPGIFGPPAPGSNGKSLSITDNHEGKPSDGAWPYRLSVVYEGTTYVYEADADARPSAEQADARMVMRDPIIINR